MQCCLNMILSHLTCNFYDRKRKQRAITPQRCNKFEHLIQAQNFKKLDNFIGSTSTSGQRQRKLKSSKSKGMKGMPKMPKSTRLKVASTNEPSKSSSTKASSPKKLTEAPKKLAKELTEPPKKLAEAPKKHTVTSKKLTEKLTVAPKKHILWSPGSLQCPPRSLLGPPTSLPRPPLLHLSSPDLMHYCHRKLIKAP